MTKNDTKSGKVYFARFTDKQTKQVFYKFGHTRNYDAMDRFTYEPEQYAKWDIKIMCTVYGPIEEMIGIEEALKAVYPKNLWLEEKISGVTEIVKFDSLADVKHIIEAFKRLSTRYYQMREKERVKQLHEDAFAGIE